MALEIRIKSEIGCLILNLKVEFDFHFSYSTAIVAKYIVICSKYLRTCSIGQFTNIWCHIHQPCCINSIRTFHAVEWTIFFITWESNTSNKIPTWIPRWQKCVNDPRVFLRRSYGCKRPSIFFTHFLNQK